MKMILGKKIPEFFIYCILKVREHHIIMNNIRVAGGKGGRVKEGYSWKGFDQTL